VPGGRLEACVLAQMNVKHSAGVPSLSHSELPSLLKKTGTVSSVALTQFQTGQDSFNFNSFRVTYGFSRRKLLYYRRVGDTAVFITAV